LKIELFFKEGLGICQSSVEDFLPPFSLAE